MHSGFVAKCRVVWDVPDAPPGSLLEVRADTSADCGSRRAHEFEIEDAVRSEPRGAVDLIWDERGPGDDFGFCHPFRVTATFGDVTAASEAGYLMPPFEENECPPELACELPIIVSPMPIVPTPPPGSITIWTVYTTVEAVVDGNYAIVKVIVDIGNRGPDPEFPFIVRVPLDAFVSGLRITRDGEVYEASVKDRGDARQEYDAWKAAQQTGGLVEKKRGSSVYSYLINVAEFTSVRAELTYETYLAADRGVYSLPLEAPVSGFGEDQGARFDVQVRDADGIETAWSAPVGTVQRTGWDGVDVSHSVGPRAGEDATQFSVSYQLRAAEDTGRFLCFVKDGVGYFAHRFRAGADPRIFPLDLVLVLDVSGSMMGEKIEQLRQAAQGVIRNLREGDRLSLVFFSGGAAAPWEGLLSLTSELRQRALDAIDALSAGGGTNIGDSIRVGFSAFQDGDSREAERAPVLAFLTDGQPTVGIEDRAELRRLARVANHAGAGVYALAFGADADFGLVRGLAVDGNGVAFRVADGAGAEVDIARFLAALTTPVLRDVVVAYDEGVQPLRNTAAALFAGSELLVVGTFDPGLAVVSGRVTGVAPDGPRSYSFAFPVEDCDAEFLPRLVAYHTIRDLQDRIDAEGQRAEWVGELRRLALEHGFVTDYTSLVLTLDPREIRPFTWTTMTPGVSALGGPPADLDIPRFLDSALLPPIESAAQASTPSEGTDQQSAVEPGGEMQPAPLPQVPHPSSQAPGESRQMAPRSVPGTGAGELPLLVLGLGAILAGVRARRQAR